MRFAFSRLVTVGFFLVLAFSATAADVSVYGVIKSAIYAQTNSGSPVPLATNGFSFDAFVYATTNDVVTNATLQPPSPSPQQTIPPLSDNTARLYDQKFSSSNAMEAVYPTGTFGLPVYGITMYTVHDGTHTGSLTFGQVFRGNYPAIAQINNFNAAQAIDTTVDFLLQWSLSGGQSQYLVEVTVNDAITNTIYASPGVGTSNALNGLSTSVTIPANTLLPGTNYTAHLRVVAPVGADTNSYPGAVGGAGLGTEVQFPMVTIAAPIHPQLSILSGKSFPFQVRFNGETNRTYHLQYTSNFSTWSDLLVTNPVTTNNVYSDAASTNKGMRFYRVSVGP